MTRWHQPPAELYTLVEHTPGTVLLESAAPTAASLATQVPSPMRTRLFTAPLRVCVANHLDQLPGLFAEIERAVSSGLFAAGYFSYECGFFFEPAAARVLAAPGRGVARPSPQTLAWFGIYQEPSVFNHETGVFTPVPAGLVEPRGSTLAHGLLDGEPAEWALSLTESEYSRQIDAIHEWIRNGDVYQLNLTWPIQVKTAANCASLYQRLRRRQPAPYGAFLHTEPSQRILSFSPELFFDLKTQGKDRHIVTRPMKGTAPRGRITQEDQALARWLQTDTKNRSENVMIVDLLRNDLGRLCAFNSVRASNLFAVERYPSLWQMTSTVSGTLRPEVNFRDIFRALFPCGSVTGAPKIRAMQLISKLESQPRGVYTGAIGFFSKAESAFNVAIRTLALAGEPPSQSGVYGVGSGIVIDSNPAEEFRECLLKAQFLTGSSPGLPIPPPHGFCLIETMLWQGTYPLLHRHLDRLEDSADYFGFAFKRDETQSAIEAYAAHFSNNSPHKVRLLLDDQGSHVITHELLSAPTALSLRICVSAKRTDSFDPMYFHKTTHRPLYTQALHAATQAGFDDVLVLNLHDEVTESAIHNVFIEKGGRLFTPPITCGVLPGVQRRHILDTNPSAQERVLTLEDLRQADAVYLCNAVRGLRRATIDWETLLP